MSRSGRFTGGSRSSLLAVALTGAIWLSACRRGHVAGTASTDDVAKAFSQAGLDADTLTKLETPDAWSAEYCVEGPVAGLSVVICEYQNDADLVVGEKKAYTDWNTTNVETGVVTHVGRTLLAISDRTKKDPSGKSIARILAAFRGVP
jgi:hypothetical protein